MSIIHKYVQLIRSLRGKFRLFTPFCISIGFLLLFSTKSCIVPYTPESVENEELLVVEGLISDQHEVNTIKLSKSHPLWKNQNPKPLKDCKVWISDDLGKIDYLQETFIGTYVTDSTNFQGKVGRKYTLHITTNADYGNLNYESFPVEMKPVPPIDSIYYEKKVYMYDPRPVEGCQIFLDTHDPANNCSFYRWKFSETWEFHLPYNVKYRVCWQSDNPNGIFIKNTSVLAEDRITGYPLHTIANPIEKLTVKYSILVKQYSMNEDEYLYWDRLKNTLDQVGGLYDLIPALIPNNIFCVENPNENILGYFSVSAVSSRRAFIKDNFAGLNEMYEGCISDTIYGTNLIPGLDETVWVLIDHSAQIPPSRIVTYKIGCAVCKVRGTDIKPSFWDDDKH